MTRYIAFGLAIVGVTVMGARVWMAKTQPQVTQVQASPIAPPELIPVAEERFEVVFKQGNWLELIKDTKTGACFIFVGGGAYETGAWASAGLAEAPREVCQ